MTWMLIFLFVCSPVCYFFGVESLLVLMVWMIFFSYLFSLNPDFYSGGLLCDSMSLGLVILSSIVVILIIMGMYSSNDMSKVILYYICLLIVVYFFLTSSLLVFFIMFELSIVPLIISMVGWGSQPERLKAVKFLIVYTLLFSSPLFFVMCVLISTCMSVDLYFWSIFPMFLDLPFSKYLVLFFLCSFFVKIPMYFFHSWLPRAHVEAPLEGSILLAGIMLKLGLYGFIRFSSILVFYDSLCNFIVSVALIGSVLSMLIAVSSDDLKICVALSSVGHMNFCLASILSGKEWAFYGVYFTLISHGISSPLLFCSVTEVYKFSHSRSVLINKGLVGKFPCFQMFNLFFWALNCSLPPTISFVGEIFCIGGLLSHSLVCFFYILFYVLGCSFFSMLMFGFQNHGGKFMLKWEGPFFSVFFFFLCFNMVFISVVLFFCLDLIF